MTSFRQETCGGQKVIDDYTLKLELEGRIPFGLCWL